MGEVVCSEGTRGVEAQAASVGKPQVGRGPSQRAQGRLAVIAHLMWEPLRRCEWE